MNLVYRRMMLGVTLAVALVLAGGARAEGTNPVPYYDDFEGYAAGTALTNITGWSSPEGVIAFVTNIGDNKAVDFNAGNDGITNTFAPNTNSQVFYLDMMMKMNLEDQELSKFDADPSIHMAFFANSSNEYCVYNWDNVNDTNRISAITNLTAVSQEWTRVTVTLDSDETGNPFVRDYFQVQINGVAGISADGMSAPASGSSSPGSWFVVANKDSWLEYVSSVALLGEGLVDDMGLTTNAPTFGLTISASIDPSDASWGSMNPTGKVILPYGPPTNFMIVASNYFYIAEIRTNYALVAGIPADLTTTNFTWDMDVGGTIKAVFHPLLAAYDVPHWWLAAQHPDWTNNFDFHATNNPDGDPDQTYIEYWTSTHPTNADSFFEIVDYGLKNGTSYFTVVCQSVDPALGPFNVQKSTNLMLDSMVRWVLATNPAGFGRVNGSNTWTEGSAASGGTPVFYRAVVTNVPSAP